MKVKIINKSKHELPAYKTIGAAGMDLCANIDKQIVLLPGECVVVPTGIHIALEPGYEAQVRPRSGLAAKKRAYAILGTIDSDYRGEVGVIFINHGNELFSINDGDRIAQMVIAKYEHIEWEQADTLDETERGDGGFGHTGI